MTIGKIIFCLYDCIATVGGSAGGSGVAEISNKPLLEVVIVRMLLLL